MLEILYTIIVKVIESEGDGENSILDLDSHIDSPVIGSEVIIIRTHDIKVKVRGFTLELSSNTVKVVDIELPYKW